MAGNNDSLGSFFPTNLSNYFGVKDVEGSQWNRNTSILGTRGSFDTVRAALPTFKKL